MAASVHVGDAVGCVLAALRTAEVRHSGWAPDVIDGPAEENAQPRRSFACPLLPSPQRLPSSLSRGDVRLLETACDALLSRCEGGGAAEGLASAWLAYKFLFHAPPACTVAMVAASYVAAGGPKCSAGSVHVVGTMADDNDNSNSAVGADTDRGGGFGALGSGCGYADDAGDALAASIKAAEEALLVRVGYDLSFLWGAASES